MEHAWGHRVSPFRSRDTGELCERIRQVHGDMLGTDSCQPCLNCVIRSQAVKRRNPTPRLLRPSGDVSEGVRDQTTCTKALR